MPDVLLFGATGYTGRLTAHALARRNARFVVAGRDRAALEEIAAATGALEVRVAAAGDVEMLVKALGDVRVLITCVGPFLELGDTAVQAALQAGVHYVDSTGEAHFIERMTRVHGAEAKAAGVALAPAMAFDEVPADVAATLAAERFRGAELVLTYALPTQASAGTVRSSLDILAVPGTWLVEGKRVRMQTAHESRWAPMPPPLGPRLAVSAHLAESQLAPLHLDVRTVKTFMTTGYGRRLALRTSLPLLRGALGLPHGRRMLEELLGRMVRRPGEGSSRGRWTILAEATSGDGRRNVVLSGRDPYGLSAELLAAGALHMADEGFDASGVLSPVQAVGLDELRRELENQGVSIEIFDPY
ncbi:MAG: saccharopine dehydrogenase family protein [Actinomycetota bacterium]